MEKYVSAYQYSRFLKSWVDPELANELGFYDYNESILANKLFEIGDLANKDENPIKIFNNGFYGWYRQDLYYYEDSEEPDDWTWSYAEVPTRLLVEYLEKNYGHKFFIDIDPRLLEYLPTIKKGGRWRTKGKILNIKNIDKSSLKTYIKYLRRKRHDKKLLKKNK